MSEQDQSLCAVNRAAHGLQKSLKNGRAFAQAAVGVALRLDGPIDFGF